MNNAPGQLLGYSMQFPRALYHLLKMEEDDMVCVEVYGDVAVLSSRNKTLTEEDKSSILGNPVTNKSINLWKTLTNWIKAVKENEFYIERTVFILYCNKAGQYAIVNKFSDAKTEEEAKAAIEYARTALKDIDQEHEIWEYFNFSINKNENILIKVVQKFDLEIGNGAGYEEVGDELRRMHIHEKQVEHISDELNGWVQKRICQKISNGEKAIISWKEFDKKCAVVFERSWCKELVDYSSDSSYDTGNVDVNNEVLSRPIYIQQLEKINIPEEEIIGEVANYLRADVNRAKWIEHGIIDEDIADDFEKKLKEFWENRRRRILITEKGLCDEDTGQLLLADCKSRQEKIRDMTPPASTIAGTYHALADNKEVGWHPDWENIFTEKEEI